MDHVESVACVRVSKYKFSRSPMVVQPSEAFGSRENLVGRVSKSAFKEIMKSRRLFNRRFRDFVQIVSMPSVFNALNRGKLKKTYRKMRENLDNLWST